MRGLLARTKARLRAILRGRSLDRDLEAELAFHFEQLEAHEAARQGRERGRAGEPEWRARRHFGGLAQIRDRCRDVRPLRALEHVLQDVRFGARLLARSPLFTAVAVLSLALGIGANSAVFSLMNGLLFRELPIDQPRELRIVELQDQSDATDRVSYPLVRSAEELMAGRGSACAQSAIASMRLSGGASAADAASFQEPVLVQLYSGRCFEVYRQRAQIGRLLGPGDNVHAGRHQVAVLSDRYWTWQFARGPVLGRELVVNGVPLAIVGVAAREFFGATVGKRSPDLWAPVVMQAELKYAGNVSSTSGDGRKPWLDQPGISWLNLVLRVPESEAAAATGLLTLAARRTQALTAGSGAEPEQTVRVVLHPGARGLPFARNDVALPLFGILVAVGVLLAIACANLAGLLIARSSNRHREMAIRLSIGAGRARLVRQLLTESLLLALLGGALGVIAAQWTLGALVMAEGRGNGIELGFDWGVMALTAAVALATGLMFGLLPAFRSTDVPLGDALKSQSRGAIGSPGRRQSIAGRWLVATQVAFSILLLVVAALFARSLHAMTAVEVGFDHTRLVVGRLDARAAGYQEAALPELHRRLIERLSSTPGVEAVSLSANGPFGYSRTVIGFEVPGYSPGRDEKLTAASERVTTGYFETLGLPIRQGRGFTAEDAKTSRPVSVINETMARRYFGTANPIGRRWVAGSNPGDASFEIVGVAADAHYHDVKETVPNMVYLAASQGADFLNSLEVRTAARPDAMVAVIRNALREAEPRLPIVNLDTLDGRIARSRYDDRMMTLATFAFGVLALALASMGLYGTISYGVSRRTTELGVRMALGASRATVIWLIMREALLLVMSGVVVGLPLAFAAATGARKLLYGVAALDLPAYTAAVAVLTIVAALAAYLPARRASRLDPMHALRAE